MKRAVYFLLLGLSSIILNAQKVGDPAPEFTFYDPTGTYYSLEQFKGKIVLLFTLGNECRSCIASGPLVEELYQEFEEEIIALGLDFWNTTSSVTTVNQFILKTGLTFPVLLKAGSLASDYSTTWDRLIIINREGEIAFKGNRIAAVDIDAARQALESLVTLSSVQESREIPRKLVLFQNYPNPFNPSTRINYRLPTDGRVCLKVYTLLGQEIATLIDQFQSAGEYSILFEPGNLPDGVYFYRLEAPGKIITRKMVVQ
jgi:peroxiredoxin